MFRYAILLVALLSQSFALTGHNMTFQLFARNLPTKDEITAPDSYVRLYEYSTSADENETDVELGKNRFGTSSKIMDTHDPNWPEIFWFWWQPRRNQKILLEVVDYDFLSHNDLVGSARIDADELFQNRNQDVTVQLSHGGNITIKKTTPVIFKLHAASLPNKDRRWGYDGPSDPYVDIYYRNGRNADDIYLTTSSVLTDEPNPVWPENFEFPQFQQRTDQYLHFMIYDDDTFTASDYIGEALVSVDELVQRRNSTTVSIGARNDIGSLTIRLVGV